MKDSLRVSFLSVGQGEATLIRCPHASSHVLIDSGQNSQLYPNASELFFSSLLRELGTQRSLDIAINTHPHPDHVSGFLALLEGNKHPSITIQRYIDNGADYPMSLNEERVRTLLDNKKIPYENTETKKLSELDLCPSLTYGEKVRLSFISLTEQEQNLLDCKRNLNDCSLVTQLEFQGISILFSADTTLRWEEIVLRSPKHRNRLKSTILKVGHHGVESSSIKLLEAVDPELAVISTGIPLTGSNHAFVYPSVDVIDRINEFFSKKDGSRKQKSSSITQACLLQNAGCLWLERPLHASVYSTATSGTIRLHAKDNRYCVETIEDPK